MQIVNGCDICDLLHKVNPLIETTHWLGYLLPNQSYLGQSDFLLKRHVGDLAQITDDELLDFKQLVETMEEAIKSAFSADVFNWSCLMNNAFQKLPSLPHVHWHLKPRYDRTVELNDIKFTDKEFGYHYDESNELIVDTKTQQLIHSRISAQL